VVRPFVQGSSELSPDVDMRQDVGGGAGEIEGTRSNVGLAKLLKWVSDSGAGLIFVATLKERDGGGRFGCCGAGGAWTDPMGRAE